MMRQRKQSQWGTYRGWTPGGRPGHTVDSEGLGGESFHRQICQMQVQRPRGMSKGSFLASRGWGEIKPEEHERKAPVWTEPAHWWLGRQSVKCPTGAGSGVASERQTPRGGSRLTFFRKSSAEDKTTWQSDRLAPPAPRVDCGVMGQASGRTSNSHPAPGPGSKGQMPHPTTPYFLSPRGQRARGAVRPAPPTAARHLLETQAPPPKPLTPPVEGGGRQVTGEKEGAGCLGGCRNLDWTGLATNRERGTSQPTLGRISLPKAKVKGLDDLSTCPPCLSQSSGASRMALSCSFPYPTSSQTQQRMDSSIPNSSPHPAKHYSTLKMAWSSHSVHILPGSLNDPGNPHSTLCCAK